jgi:hypothetical protein
MVALLNILAKYDRVYDLKVVIRAVGRRAIGDETNVR